jgi:23S rRNA pseudouridine2604 synthase
MAFRRRYDESEPQRVNRWLAQTGVCSRREAEGLIARGLVSIDGETVHDVGRKILPGQTLALADQAEHLLDAQMSIILHKPKGIVSAQPESGQIPAVRLLTRDALWAPSKTIPGPDSKLAPVGRLDMDSRGLLILSEDGVLAKAVIGPASDLEKEYRVAVMGEITDAKIARLRHGLALDGRQLKPAEVDLISDQRLRFVRIAGVGGGGLVPRAHRTPDPGRHARRPLAAALRSGAGAADRAVHGRLGDRQGFPLGRLRTDPTTRRPVRRSPGDQGERSTGRRGRYEPRRR